MGKAREFWIKQGDYETCSKETFYSTVIDEYDDYWDKAELIHVIEKNASDKLEAALKLLLFSIDTKKLSIAKAHAEVALKEYGGSDV